MKPTKLNMVVCIISLIIVLVLEITPYGAVVAYGNPSESGQIELVKTYLSYFNIIPFGRGNFAPLVTAILTCILIITTLVAMLKNTKQGFYCAKILAGITTVVSIFPIFLFVYSLVGLLISLTLLLGFILLSKQHKAFTYQ